MESEIYLVIKTGYEGIEELCFGTLDEQKAVGKIKELKNKVQKYIDELEELKKNNPNKNCSEINDIMYDKYDDFSTVNKPDFYCIQKFDNDKQEFICVCSLLEVSPSKLMLR